MHGELRHADVHGQDGRLSGGDIAQGGAAGLVGTVGIALHRHLRPAADLGEDGGGHAVGGIARRVLDHHALAQHGRIDGVGQLGVVGMDSVAIVTGEGKAVGEKLPVAVLGEAQRPGNGAEGIGQEGRGCAKHGLRADLFVVEDPQHRNGAALLGHEEALGAGKAAGQIVQPRRGEELPVPAPGKGLLAVIDEEVGGEDLVLPASGRCRHLGAEATLVLPQSVEGIEVPGKVELAAAAGLAVQVDGHAGNEHLPGTQVDEPRLNALGRAHQHPAGDAQGAIEPAAGEHAAVALAAQAGEAPRERRFLAELKAG